MVHRNKRVSESDPFLPAWLAGQAPAVDKIPIQRGFAAIQGKISLICRDDI
jgi:hypothetical protein